MLFEELPSKELPMSALKDIDMTRFARVLKLKKGDTIAGTVFLVVAAIAVFIPVLCFSTVFYCLPMVCGIVRYG